MRIVLLAILIMLVAAIIGLAAASFVWPEVSGKFVIEYGEFKADGEVGGLGYAALLVVLFIVTVAALPFSKPKRQRERDRDLGK